MLMVVVVMVMVMVGKGGFLQMLTGNHPLNV
jgi:hypothetical protein